MEVVRNVDQAVLERYLRGAWNGIGGDDGNAVLGKQRWQFVVDQVDVYKRQWLANRTLSLLHRAISG